MPRGGSKPGERRGGRPKGGLNKRTIQQQKELAEANRIAGAVGTTPAVVASVQKQMQAAAAKTPPRAKDELAALILVVKGHVASIQRAALATPAPGEPGFNADLWRMLRDWLDLLKDVANKAADFQDPRYRAIAVAMTPGEGKPEPKVIEDTEPLDASERERRAGQAYLRLVKA